MRALSIDGGGIRGLIPAVVLAELESRTGKRVAELFDHISGTSTGGILACALTRQDPDGLGPLYSAAQLCALYESEGPKIFHRSLLKRIASAEGYLDERYEDDGLRAALDTYLGDARLRDALKPVLVTAYDIEGRFALLFRSERAKTDPRYDFSLANVAHATSAAPTYFEPVQVTDAARDRTYTLIDGGVYAGNPAMCGYADLAQDGRQSEIKVLLSLGTGAQTRSYPYAQARGWGQLEWARRIVDVIFDGHAETIDFQLDQLLFGGRYFRFQTRLDLASDNMDDASAENLVLLRQEAEQLIERESERIDRVCELLAS